MIEVTYYREYNRLTVTGHAHSDEIGKDLVCSAASILARTLAENIEQMALSGAVRSKQIRMEPGDCEIQCCPVSQYKGVIGIVFTAICNGYRLLADTAGEYVQYQER